MWDIVEFCRRGGILCQGRGSAANSAVCYALGITNVDAVSLDLLFERFLSPARDGPPDIDVDIESGRREEVIQYVYERYGRHRCAQVANVITYRSRSAVRDAAKALGHAESLSKLVDYRQGIATEAADPHSSVPAEVLELATQIEHFPRHLGIHSGGMVICDRPVIEVCPVEWARMEGRSVLQWDKDDCATVGLVKFDLLGLDGVRGIGEKRAAEIDAGRPYRSVEDLRRRVPSLSTAALEALATSGAFGCFDLDRRGALWTAGALGRAGAGGLPGITVGDRAPPLPAMSPAEVSRADLWATGVAPDGHPTRFIREQLAALGVVTAADLAGCSDGKKVLVGGVVTHRQRPATAGGVIFLSLEDESGLMNVVVSPGCWQYHRKAAATAPALLVRGRLEHSEGVLNVVAERLEALPAAPAPASRDFR